MRIFFFIIFFLLSFLLQGQNLRTMGLVFDDSTYYQIPKKRNLPIGTKSYKSDISTVTKIDLKPYCPLPGDQGEFGSCVGWAAGYAALTISDILASDSILTVDQITRRAYSPLFLYNQAKISDSICNSGARIIEVLELMKEKGSVLFDQFDINNPDCQVLPQKGHYRFAKEHRISKYYKVFDLEEQNINKVNATKLSLIERKPVIVGLELPASFLQIKFGDKFWYPSIGDSSYIIGGHAMVVIGYDDEKRAFEVINSWGPYWGNNGFIWIRYHDFARYCKYGFQLILDKKNTTREPEKSGFDFFDVTRSIIKPTELITFWNGIFYEFKHSIPLGSKLQISAKEVPAGSYIYVLNIEPTGQVSLLYPRMQRGGFIPTDFTKLAIPGEDFLVQFNKPGLETICFLQGRYPILDIQAKLEQLNKREVIAPWSQILNVFDDRLVMLKNIRYTKNKIEAFGYLQEFDLLPFLVQIEVK
ncbi:MAG: C1 family peptidase [Saprospiraceae bacterium]